MILATREATRYDGAISCAGFCSCCFTPPLSRGFISWKGHRQLLRGSGRGVRALRYKTITTNRLFLRHYQLQSTHKRNERVPDNAYGRRSAAAIMNTDVTDSLANRWEYFRGSFLYKN